MIPTSAHLFSKSKKLALIIFITLFPSVSLAAVSISEIAWMGSTDSANHEWVELYNDGEATDVTGWTINDGLNLNIELEGMIPAGSYVVLERTSDDSADGSAFFIYTGALINTGATLRLLRTDGSVVDQVSGSENWENIGGDNVTKETTQYTSAGWVTAVATPGKGINESAVVSAVEKAAVDSSAVVTDDNSGQSSVKNKSKSSGGETVLLRVPDVTLRLLIEGQTVGYVNQVIDFSVKPTGIGKTLIDSLTYEWNFGDGLTSKQKKTEHIFKYPGKYVVTVYGSYKRQKQVARHEITILPVTMSLTKNPAGDVQINNDSPYEIDISGYKIIGIKTFVFPERSIILPNQTVTIPKVRLGKMDNLTILYDAEQGQIASLLPDRNTKLSAVVDKSVGTVGGANLAFSDQYPVASDSFNFAVAAPAPLLVVEDEVVLIDEDVVDTSELVSEDLVNEVATRSVAISPKSDKTDERWYYLALVGVLMLAVAGMYVNPNRNQKD